MSDEEDEAEEDWRIAKLFAAADKSSPEEFAALVDKVGTKDAIVFGGVMMDQPTARAHFVVLALVDLDDGSLADCLGTRRALLKAAVAAGGAGAGSALIAALEGLLCSPSTAVEGEARESAMSSFDEALKVLWEYEVVSEDELRAWQADERAGRNYQVSSADAIRLHEKGREFLEWVDEGE
uniref:W2 domain-containing protein n=1 Tax=Calcidiscus leptoporus TaxID=127549 RepID=A0A6U5L5X4_9EUKA